MNYLLIFSVLFLIASINASSMMSLKTKMINQKLGRLHQLLRDNHGCDAVVQSCGHRGACCDVHDACYARNGCTAHSWLTMCKFIHFILFILYHIIFSYIFSVLSGVDWDNCADCNFAAMQCVAFHQPGESSCCHSGNCGQHWK